MFCGENSQCGVQMSDLALTTTYGFCNDTNGATPQFSVSLCLCLCY